MAGGIGKLIGAIRVGVIADTKKASKDIKGFQKDVSTSGKKIEKSLGAMKSAFSAFVAVAGTGRAVGMFRDTIADMDRLIKTSSKLGLGTDELIGLQHAAQLTGVEANTLSMAMQRMTRRISEAAVGTGEAKGALEELGLDAEALNLMGPAKAFSAIAEAIKTLQNPTDKLRLAFKLFDSEGAALVNTLELGKTGLEEMAKEAKSLGLTFSNETAKGIEAAANEIARLEAEWTGLKRRMTSGAVPWFANYLEGLRAMEKYGYRGDLQPSTYSRGAMTAKERADINKSRRDANLAALRADANRAITKLQESVDRQTSMRTVRGYTGSGWDNQLSSFYNADARQFKDFTKESRTQEPRMTIETITRPLNRIIDANSREGFAALRANMRQSTTKKLEEQGEKQISELKNVNQSLTTIIANTEQDAIISIPGAGSKPGATK